jgi:hypothetical protein
VNEPTSFGPYNEALRRRYGVGGQSGPVLTLASDAFPVVGVSEELEDPENQYLSGHALGIAQNTQAAVALQLAHVALANPIGSGAIVVVQGIWSLTNDTTVHLRGLLSADLLGRNITSGLKRDPRPAGAAWPNTTAGTIAISQVAQLGTFLAARGTVAGADTEFPFFPIVLPPGTGIAIMNNAVNLALTARFLWRERRASEWELP